MCKNGKTVEEVTKETRKSSSAGVVMLHTKTEDHYEEQCRGRAVCGSTGSVRIERNRVVAGRPGIREEASVGH